ncbi:MAG: hypothetical protein R3F35_13995 [Myxococcota bacterium]
MAAVVASALGGPPQGLADSLAAAEPAAGREAASVVAVARPNLRAGIEYGYAHVDATRTSASGPGGTQTLRLGAESGQSVTGRLVATVPVFSIVGLRAGVHGGFREARRSLDALEPGESTLDGYGALAELLVRDPRRGSVAVGGGYDRLEGDGGVSADQLTARAEAQIYFPDFGSGPVDWFASFAFRHRQVAGSGQSFDVDADVYDVRGGARWYAGPDVAVVFAGQWTRSEEEFFSEDDATGALDLHWRLPVAAGPVGVEVFAGGFAGVSEYKEPPFRGDRRLLYGGRAGVTLRLFSGVSLLEAIRRFD